MLQGWELQNLSYIRFYVRILVERIPRESVIIIVAYDWEIKLLYKI